MNRHYTNKQGTISLSMMWIRRLEQWEVSESNGDYTESLAESFFFNTREEASAYFWQRVGDIEQS
jgi:hypothetical protein